MLPPPLAPPLPTRPVRRPRRPLLWGGVLGALLVIGGVLGTIVWVGALSPYGFIRFSLPRADRTITISRPGDYLLFEEYAGAADADLPSALLVTVIDDGGRSIDVENLVEPGRRGAPFTYHVPPNEGRAVARFDAPRAGLYLVQVEPLELNALDRAGYRDRLPDQLAVGRQLAWNWMRTPLGLLAFGLVPLAAGTLVLVRVLRRRRLREPEPAREPPRAVR